MTSIYKKKSKFHAKKYSNFELSRGKNYTYKSNVSNTSVRKNASFIFRKN